MSAALVCALLFRAVNAQPLLAVQHSALMTIYDDLGCSACMRFAASSNCIAPATCSEGYVTRLGIGGSVLNGTISPALSQLTRLQYLNLRGNGLTGTIPSSMGQMAALTYLTLYSNRLSGTIPSQFALLTKLVDLHVYDNFLSGPYPQGPWAPDDCNLQLAMAEGNCFNCSAVPSNCMCFPQMCPTEVPTTIEQSTTTTETPRASSTSLSESTLTTSTATPSPTPAPTSMISVTTPTSVAPVPSTVDASAPTAVPTPGLPVDGTTTLTTIAITTSSKATVAPTSIVVVSTTTALTASNSSSGVANFTATLGSAVAPLSDIALIAGVSGGIGVCCLIVLVGFFFACRHRRAAASLSDVRATQMHDASGGNYETGLIDIYNDAPSAGRIAELARTADSYEEVPPSQLFAVDAKCDTHHNDAPLSVVDAGRVSERFASARAGAGRVSERFASARADDVAHRIDASELAMGDVLGQGAFGIVRRAQWRGRSVAVKQIKRSAIGDSITMRAFEDEIGRMAALQPHENCVQLYGVVELPDGDVGAVVEFCAQGALVGALYGANARPWNIEQLLHIAYDSACGVMHLHASDIVHRDIAARNVLLAGKVDIVAKVSDFGMARDIDCTQSGAEQETLARIGPVRWMAPEQISRLAYSKSSDVFAFGVLLFEIFERQQPWMGLANVNVISRVVAGERMPAPAAAPSNVQAVIQQCWAHDASSRPNMRAICAVLQQYVHV